ncbi:hypothetical protein BC829DRAFT_492940 [Chytridium lagenaria]|nr:hypothetical protein BC829DRAFT_492940 [Chytridium lagenaria]
MFKKPFAVRSQTTVRSSDRRKLRTEILTAFPAITETELTSIFPVKEGKDGEHEMTVVKFTSHSGVQGILYTIGGQPLFMRIDETLIPTVYALWALPHMVPLFTTHGVVMKRLFDGADLMLPGVIVPTAGWEGSWKVGDLVGVVVRGYGCPLAVGTALVGAEEIKRSGFVMRGKGVKTLHSYGDLVWSAGDKSEPPENVGEVDDGDEYEDEPDEEDAIVDATVDTAASASLATLSISDPPAEPDKPSPTEAPTATPAEMDKLLEQALITAIKLKLTDDPKTYPITSSVLYENFVGPCRAFGTSLDVKVSGYKKLSKFLKSMEKKGYVKLKERNGDTLLMGVNRKHPEIVAFQPPRRLAGDGGSTASLPAAASKTTVTAATASPASSAGPTSVAIVELYRGTGTMARVLAEVAVGKDAYLTKSDVKNAMDEYVKVKELISDDPRLIKLDPFLADALLRKDENDVDFLARESLLTRVIEKMSPFYEITLPGHEAVIKKGSPKPIQIIVEVRQGRKNVTRVAGMEVYGIDPEDLAKELKVRCASSTTVTPLPGKSSSTPLHEVMVQGSKIREVCECLVERYKIPFGGGGRGGKVGGGVVNYGLKGGPQSRFVEILDKTEKK